MESGVPKRGAPGAERRRRTEPSRAESAAAAYEEGEDVRFAAAYHGTGAEFDRFSDDKIGTGEGAQAYGDGHYFASTREVAEWYRKQLGGRDWKPQLDGRDVEDSDGRVPAYAAAALLRQGDGFGRVSFVQDAINSLRQEAAEIRDDGSAGSAEEAKGYDRDAEWLEEHKDRVSYRKPGRLLKVDLAPAEDEYLLWDTLLDEQPATVQRALEATDWYSYAKDRLDVLPDNPTGRDLYKDMLADRSPREASAALLAAGVRGIKYLEGASRSKGEGNYNYVIFDPADIKITARFAVAPPLDSPAFKRWFDDSKVVDESGKPLVVYHGTTANFSEFEPSWHDETVWEGSAFSTNPEVARAYADDDFHRRSPGDDAGSRIMPVYIASDVFPTSMEMHRIIERELGEDWWDNKETRDQWRDVALRLGIRAINTEDIGAPGEIFVIDPTAVKSATGNRGTYDAANPDVRFAVGPGESRRLNRMAAVIDAAYARGEGARAERWEGLLAEAEEAIGTREEALLEGNADEDLEGVNVAETDSRDLEDWIIHSWRSMRGDDLERSPSALGYDATDIAGNIRGNVQNAGISIPPSVTDGDLLDLAKELSRDRSAMVAARRARDVRFAAGEPQDAPLEEIDGGALAPLPAGTEQEDALEEITVPGRGSVAAAIQGVFRGKLSGAAAIPVAEGGEFALPAEDDLQALNRKFADYFARARVAQRRAGEQGEEADVDLAETTYYGRARARIDRLALVYDKPLKGVAQKVGLENLDRYLIALHTPTRRALMEERHPKVAESAAPEWGSGMSLEDARGVVAEVEASPQRALYRRGARLVHQMLSEALDTRVEAGLLSEEGATAWREQFGGAYVPLKTDKDPADHSFRAGRGFAVTGAESKRARGRESLADSPTAFSASQAVQVVQRAEKNRVGLALLELVRQNPSANVWEEVAPTRGRDGALVPPKQEYHTVTGALDKKDQLVPSLFMLKEDGQERYIRLKDPLMAQAMSKMGMAHASSVVAALAKVSRLLSAMATSWNPEFLLRNFSKDLQTASVHIAGEESAAMALEVVKSTPASIRGIWRARRSPKAAGRWEDAYREFSMAGGETGWTGSSLTIEERMNALAKEMERGYTLSALQGIGSLLNDANGAVENGVRLAAFVAARKRGVSRARAASLAKHLTVNFNRKGEWGTVMNSLWLFYNAGLQGNLEMLSRLGRSRRVQAIAGGIVAASFALSLLNRLMAGDDEDGVGQWEKTQEWVKQDYWIFMYPDGSGRRVTIPVPWGYNVFHSVGIQLEHVIFGDKPAPEAVGNVGLAVMDAFNPLGQSASLSQWLAPTVVDPVVQVSENQTWYGGTIYPNNFDNRPDSQLYWADVTPAARDAVELLNRLTGGTKARPGMIDVSPETIEHVLGFAGSGAGRFGLNSLKTVQDAISGEELDWNKLPILRAFFGTEDPRFTERLFSENTRLIDVAEKEAKVDAENQKTPWLVRLGRYASRAQTRVKKAKQSGNDDAAHEIMRQLNRRVREAAESRNQ
ncbi:MAG: hypothetical protein GY820_24480 [Gammaproteobacteria bacterium]|nr:hypothetical protein [Gammaproteobacteria bacterium]